MLSPLYHRICFCRSYRWYLRSDDSSFLDISTLAWPSHRMTRVVTLNGCCREQSGSSVYLRKGGFYLVRAIMKEGGGGEPMLPSYTLQPCHSSSNSVSSLLPRKF